MKRKARKAIPTLSYDPALCSCGSGLSKRALVDAHGIFCTNVCDLCEKRRSARYRPEIFTGPYVAEEPLEED